MQTIYALEEKREGAEVKVVAKEEGQKSEDEKAKEIIAEAAKSSIALIDEVDKIVEKMQSLYDKTKSPALLPSTATYSTIFFLLSKMRDTRAPERATKMIDEMNSRQGELINVRPDATTYAYLINIFTKTYNFK